MREGGREGGVERLGKKGIGWPAQALGKAAAGKRGPGGERGLLQGSTDSGCSAGAQRHGKWGLAQALQLRGEIGCSCPACEEKLPGRSRMPGLGESWLSLHEQHKQSRAPQTTAGTTWALRIAATGNAQCQAIWEPAVQQPCAVLVPAPAPCCGWARMGRLGQSQQLFPGAPVDQALAAGTSLPHSHCTHHARRPRQEPKSSHQAWHPVLARQCPLAELRGTSQALPWVPLGNPTHHGPS